MTAIQVHLDGPDGPTLVGVLDLTTARGTTTSRFDYDRTYLAGPGWELSPDLPLAFWTWHDKVEDQHAAHTDDELAEAFAQPWFDEERFLAGATRMLDGVEAFWDGLWADHQAGVER